MDRTSFRVGDLVVLKSGSPPMTIFEINYLGDTEKEAVKLVHYVEHKPEPFVYVYLPSKTVQFYKENKD